MFDQLSRATVAKGKQDLDSYKAPLAFGSCLGGNAASGLKAWKRDWKTKTRSKLNEKQILPEWSFVT